MSIPIDNLANAVMEHLTAYRDMTSDTMKSAVRKAAKIVKSEISENAPKDSGDYAKSWTTSAARETSSVLRVTVHSRNRYQLAHLLEHGHAKRGGGRVAAQPHIAPAEQDGEAVLLQEIERGLSYG